MIVQFQGRLGNQFFQYAHYRTIQKKYAPQRLVVDASYYAPDETMELERIFGLSLPRCTDAERQALGKEKKILPYRVARVLGVSAFWQGKHVITDRGFFKKKVKEDTYFRGYWQSEKHFAAARAEICSALTFPAFTDAQNIACAQQIAQGNAAFLHVRRGDYLCKSCRAVYLTLSETQYYQNAIALLKAQNPNYTFFIFSDDIPWCKTAFAGLNAVYIDWNAGEDAWKDLSLMSQCDVGVVANSSFSWWGAYLGKEKKVYAPTKIGDAFEKTHPNYFPDAWQRIAVE